MVRAFVNGSRNLLTSSNSERGRFDIETSDLGQTLAKEDNMCRSG